MTETETRPRSSGKAGTAAEWAGRGVHHITLPSGMEVDIRFPDLAILIEGDALPEKLRVVAAEMWQSGAAALIRETGEGENRKLALDLEMVKGLASLRRYCAAASLVSPKMTADELLAGDIPAEDIDMLADIAMREQGTDALGVSLGVEPLSRWETFREEHGCPADCQACEASRDRFSVRRADRV